MPNDSTSNVVVRTVRLRKEYADVVALRALDLDVGAGEIFALVGPNGAGKSTLLQLLATALRADYGSAVVAGYDVEKKPLEVRKRIGYMPDFFGMYENVTVEDFLTYFALAYGLDRSFVPGRVDELLEAVTLSGKRGADISELSRGMRQRLVFAKTIVHDPDVLLLDEPLSGLDPRARREMRELMGEFHERGKTIIISSHILSELTDFCTSVGILEKGVLRLGGSIDEILLRIQGGRMVTVEVVGEVKKAIEIISGHPAVEFAAPGEKPLEIGFEMKGDREAIAQINAKLVEAGIGVMAIRERRGDLEDIYMKTAADEVQ